jgi:hypothetical protein
MQVIWSTNSERILVDDWNYDWLNKYTWNVADGRYTWYAISNRIFMHRLIMNTPEGLVVDHKDWNGLNNQESNLRNCTHQVNSWNRRNNPNWCRQKLREEQLHLQHPIEFYMQRRSTYQGTGEQRFLKVIG